MLRIPCPFCGERDETEFHYGAQAALTYPEEPAALGDTEWAQFLFYRDNPKGWLRERWFHGSGCRSWFELDRHTATDEIRPVGGAS